MVDSQSIDEAGGKQLAQQPVGILKYLRVIHPQGRQFIYVEEAAVVYFVRGCAPVRQPVGLGFEQFVQEAGAPGPFGRLAVESSGILAHELGNVRAPGEQGGQVAFVYLLIAGALLDSLGADIVARWQVAESGHQGLQFE